MTFDPTTNRIPMGLLTEEEKEILKAAKHGLEIYSAPNGWVSCEEPRWAHFAVYRAKPAPVVNSVWVNVSFEPYGSLRAAAYHSLRAAYLAANSYRIGVARFDLIDGVLSVELEPLEDNNG